MNPPENDDAILIGVGPLKAHPEAGGQITDCLFGDVNNDSSQLWSWIREFVPLPDDLPYGEPLIEELASAAGTL